MFWGPLAFSLKTLKYSEVEEALFLAVSKGYMDEKKREGILKLFISVR
jgi:hypothetical protein